MRSNIWSIIVTESINTINIIQQSLLLSLCFLNSSMNFTFSFIYVPLHVTVVAELSPENLKTQHDDDRPH